MGVVIVLLIGSITAVATAPPITSIEQKYAHGELVLDVEQLDSAHQAFAIIAQSDDRNGTPGPKIIPGSVSIVGDSVTLGAVDELSAQTDASIDADTSRAMVNGIRIIKNMEQNLTLGETVVVALATNSHADSYESAVTIINDLEPGHRIVFVTGYGDSSISDLNLLLRTLSAQYPFVTIADWEAAIQDKDSLLAADHMHMDAQEARNIYAQVIKTAIEEAKWKPTS
ncbi:hypothetical protein FACS1894104_4310 [Actinomycetota bacterium]|nr:hypothetical protein FACS1894104_4310 [Actinomycetota bacterium]